MKKACIWLLLAGLLTSVASAQLLIGSKASGMGGAGVANVTDLAAVYYNPAALMESSVKAAEVKISLGAAYSKPDKLVDAASNASDPATFLANNYANELKFSGNIDGIIGVNVRKIGISVLPIAKVLVNKNALSMNGFVNAGLMYDTVLTLGTSRSIPGLPIGQIDFGANIKSINAINGNLTTNTDLRNPANSTGTVNSATGTGVGFDVGALASFNVPMVTNFKAGVVMRDLGESIKYSNKTQVVTIDPVTKQVTKLPEVVGPETTVTVNSSTALGASAVIPGLGATIAGDIEMTNPDTNIHMGVEYPMLLGLLIVRAGVASGPNLGLTTVGVKINLPILTLDVAMIADSKNTDMSSAVVDINLGF